MDSAHSGDLVPVAAKDIGKIEGWKRIEWYCLGCPLRVYPAACDPDEKHKTIPYFSRRNGKHADDCDIAGLQLLIKRARKRPIQWNDELLGYLPRSVEFRDSPTTVGGPRVKPGGEGGEGGDATPWPGSGGSNPTRYHLASRSMIEPVCKAHAALKDNEFRETQSLNVPGCLGSNYRDVFYQLQNIRSADPPELHSCIFYGELRFRSKPNYDNPDKLVLTLNRGIRPDGNQSERLYRLIIRWRGWREQLRMLCIREIEAKRLATNRRYDDPERDRSKTFVSDILVYFLGKQVDGSPMDFEVSDYRKYAIVVEPNGLYKDYPNHSFLKKAVPRADVCQPPQPRTQKNYPMPPAPEPPSWVGSDFSAPATPPKSPEAPAVPRSPVTREQPAAPSVTSAQPSPVIAQYHRGIDSGENRSYVSPEYFERPPKLRSGFFGWFKSLFG